MAIDISKLGSAAREQAVRKLQELDAKKAARGGKLTHATTGGGENKVHAQKTEDGYASKREQARASELRLMQAAGEIYNLREQVKYVLVPAIYRKPDGTLVKNYDLSKNKRDLEKAEGCKLELLERNEVYQADFVYEQDGQTIVEDAKGMRKTNAAVYRLFVNKRKLMLHIYGIRVKEV